jgi:hypothetical protein
MKDEVLLRRVIQGIVFANFVRYVLSEKIVRLKGGKWAVYPKKGGNRLGTHDTKASALRQLAAIEISKNRRKA